MLKKLNSNDISTNDLKSECTLTNQRMSKKGLETVNSSEELINADVYSAMLQHDVQNTDF